MKFVNLPTSYYTIGILCSQKLKTRIVNVNSRTVSFCETLNCTSIPQTQNTKGIITHEDILGIEHLCFDDIVKNMLRNRR